MAAAPPCKRTERCLKAIQYYAGRRWGLRGALRAQSPAAYEPQVHRGCHAIGLHLPNSAQECQEIGLKRHYRIMIYRYIIYAGNRYKDPFIPLLHIIPSLSRFATTHHSRKAQPGLHPSLPKKWTASTQCLYTHLRPFDERGPLI